MTSRNSEGQAHHSDIFEA